MGVVMETAGDLTGNEKDVSMTLVAGAANCVIPPNARLVGLLASAAGVRVRVGAAPAALAAVVGNVAVAQLSAGTAVPNSEMVYYALGGGMSRTLYFTGAGAEVVQIRFF